MLFLFNYLMEVIHYFSVITFRNQGWTTEMQFNIQNLREYFNMKIPIMTMDEMAFEETIKYVEAAFF